MNEMATNSNDIDLLDLTRGPENTYFAVNIKLLVY